MNNSGTILDHIDYNGFGLITNETNPSNGDRYKFTGREFDSELPNLGYYRARWYQVAAGKCSRGSIARLRYWLSTLRRVDRSTATQDSLPAAGQALPGGIQYPQGSIERF